MKKQKIKEDKFSECERLRSNVERNLAELQGKLILIYKKQKELDIQIKDAFMYMESLSNSIENYKNIHSKI